MTSSFRGDILCGIFTGSRIVPLYQRGIAISHSVFKHNDRNPCRESDIKCILGNTFGSDHQYLTARFHCHTNLVRLLCFVFGYISSITQPFRF